jgi:hypothetical protein
MSSSNPDGIKVSISRVTINLEEETPTSKTVHARRLYLDCGWAKYSMQRIARNLTGMKAKLKGLCSMLDETNALGTFDIN